MIGILGGGFGLYGYLPACLLCPAEVALPARYRPRLVARPELASLDSRVHWLADESAVVAAADTVILALPPVEQDEWIARCLDRPNVTRLLLEKPLAASPERASQVLDQLNASRRTFRINYGFASLLWADRVEAAARLGPDAAPLRLNWHFHAHHFRTGLDTWKRHRASGGGVVRFYGIHVIGLLAGWGYDQVASCRITGLVADEPARWQATFLGPGLAPCHIDVDSCAADTQFTWHAAEPLVLAADPFDEDAAAAPVHGQDRRVTVLREACLTLLQATGQPSGWYAQSIRLWQAVEDAAR